MGMKIGTSVAWKLENRSGRLICCCPACVRPYSRVRAATTTPSPIIWFGFFGPTVFLIKRFS